MLATVSDGRNTTTNSFVLRVAASPDANAPKLLVSLTPSTPVLPGQVVLATVRADAFSPVASLTVQARGAGIGQADWVPVTLDGLGRVRLTPSAPGLIELRVTAVDADGFSSTATQTIRVRDPLDTAAPQLAFSGALNTGGLAPAVISSTTALTARIADLQLMGYVLEAAPSNGDRVDESAWRTLAQADTTGSLVNADLTLAMLDPSKWANGVYLLRLRGWDLTGRTTEIMARILVDSTSKQLVQAQATDAVFHLGGHDLALTRSLDVNGSGDFGNWTLPLLDMRLSHDQAGSDSLGSASAWLLGARVWLQAPSSLSAPNAATQYLSFSLDTTSQPLSSDPTSPQVLHPVFVGSTPGWTLTALDADPDVPVTLQAQGLRLLDRATGLPWQPSGYELIGPDGTRYRLDTRGQVLSVRFADGQQWLVSDAGVALVGSNDPGERFVIERDSQGRIERATGRQVDGIDASIVYRYDGQGRLTLARSLYGAGGLNENIGYHADGSVIGEPITAQLGTAAGWLAGVAAPTNRWSGNLDAATPARFSFVVRDSEIASTIKTQGGAGAVIYAVETTAGGSLAVEGATVLGQVSNGGKTITLIRVTESGLKLLALSGSGAAELKITLAGDLNRDGKVDGADSAAFAATGADLNGDGVTSDSDRQILYANYGWRANQAPVGTPDSAPVLTHTDLGKALGLEDVAIDAEGDALFWRVLSTTHGSARLTADGRTLEFTPEAGYAGPADVTLQADDGYSASSPIKVNFNVSGAKLIALHVDRLATLTSGQTRAFQVLGDFEDQSGVALTPGYVSFSVIDGTAVGVDAQGFVHGLKAGSSIVSIQARGIEAVNAISVTTDGFGPFLDIDGFEVGVYPRAITLVQNGLRQLKVSLPDHTDISAGSTGTRYFIADPTLAEVSADGLIRALKTGETTISVVHNGMQHDIVLRVQLPTLDTATTTAGGAAVIDAQGNLMMVAPGALPEGTAVSIKSRSVDDLGMPPPAADIMNVIGAVDIDLGGQKSSLPLQLAVKLAPQIDPATGQPVALAAGTEVFFWRKGTIVDGQGVTHDTWWLVDNGVVGVDGFARTSSPPFDGVGSAGTLVATTRKVIDSKTGAVQVTGAFINFNAIWSEMAFVAMAPSPMMAIEAMGIFASMSHVSAIKYTLDGTYQLDVPVTALTPETISLQFPAEPSGPEYTPDITGLSFDPTTRKLTISGSNFLPPGSPSSNYQLKVWLEPRGDQMEDATGYGARPDRGLIWQAFSPSIKSDGSLEITLDPGIALSQHIVHVERVVLVPDGNGVAEAGDSIDSTPVEAWQEAAYTNSLVLSADAINIFADGSDKTTLGLVKKLTVDEQGRPLDFRGGRTDLVAFTEDGTLAFIAGRNGRIYVMDTETQEVVHTLELQGSTGSLNSILVADGWLYVAEGQAGGGRLMRVNVDQTSAEFLRTQQQLRLMTGNLPLGFGDMAVSFGRYLAVTALHQYDSVSNFPKPEPGDVYIIDLATMTNDAFVNNAIVLNSSNFPGQNVGRAPKYITAGTRPGEFLLSSSKDYDHGVTGITVNLDENGNLAGGASAVTAKLTPAATDGNWLQKKYQQNIQRAAGNVVVTYKGVEYALVADYNFIFNDVHFVDYENYGFGKQIGGKIGVIQDPFGHAGGPRYLGATSPIPGGTIGSLSLGVDGSLSANVWMDDEFSTGEWRMYQSLFVWNAEQLVEAAIRADGRAQSMPIDRDKVGGDQLVVPKRYDSPDGGANFNWLYGLGSYVPSGVTIELYDNGPSLPPIPPDPPAQPLSYSPQSAEPKMGILQTLAIRAGAETTYLLAGIYGSLRGIVGLDTKNQIDTMKEARAVLDTVKYDKSSPGNNVAAIALNVIEGFATGLVDLPLEFIEGTSRIAAVLVAEEVNALKDMGAKIGLPVDDMQYIPPDLPMMSQMARAYENGASMGDLLKMAGIQTAAVTPVGGAILSAEALAKSAKEGDTEGILSALLGLGLSGKMAASQLKSAASATRAVIAEAKGAPTAAAAAAEVLNASRKATLKAVQDVYDASKSLKTRLQTLLEAKKKNSNQKVTEEGPAGVSLNSPERIYGTALKAEQELVSSWKKLPSPRAPLESLEVAIEAGALDAWKVDKGSIQMMSETALAEAKLPAGSRVIVMKRGDAGFVGQEVRIVIETPKQMAELFNKNPSGTAEAIAAYELPNYQSAKSPGRIFYDELKSQPITFFMREDMLGTDQGFMTALAHERLEYGLTLETIRLRGEQGVLRTELQKIINDDLHVEATFTSDMLTAEQLLTRYEKEAFKGELFDRIRNMGKRHEADLLGILEGRNLKVAEQVGYELVDANGNVVGEPGYFDFVTKDAAGVQKIVEAKSSYARDGILEDGYNLRDLLTDNQRVNYPLINSGTVKVRITSIRNSGSTGLEVGKFLENLDFKTIQMELRKYSDKVNMVPQDRPTPVDVDFSQKTELVSFVDLLDQAHETLTPDEIEALLPVARGYWVAAGIPEALLDNVSFSVATLPSGVVGQESGSQIQLSVNGGGWGWFVDATPEQAQEFSATLSNTWVAPAGSVASSHVDLLTVMIHEMGHVMGLDDVIDGTSVMSAVLQPGMRHLPSSQDVAHWLTLQQSAGSMPVAAQETLRIGSAAGSTSEAPSYPGQAAEQVPLASNAHLLAAGLANWNARGSVSEDAAGDFTLRESAASQTRLFQVFDLHSEDHALSFTIDASQLRANRSGPGDAFEVALLDAATGLPVAGHISLSGSDALLNLQTNGTERLAPTVSRQRNADGSVTYFVALAPELAGKSVLLSFDLLGFAAQDSAIGIRDVQVISDVQAVNDAVTLDEDNAAVIDVLANDVTLGATNVMVEQLDGPVHGSLSLGADGKFHYEPAANFNGTDSFSYRFSVDGKPSNTATVTLTVRPVNDAPTLLGRSVQAQAGVPLALNPLSTAFDVDGDALTAAVVAGPAHGTLMVMPDGSFSYLAASAYVGADSFSYKVSDGQADSITVTVAITVANDAPANQAPTANDTQASGVEDQGLQLSWANFAVTDPDDRPDQLQVEITALPVNGELQRQQADGSWASVAVGERFSQADLAARGLRFVPAANASGGPSYFGSSEGNQQSHYAHIGFKAFDGELYSPVASLVIDIAAVADAPTLSITGGNTVTGLEDTALALHAIVADLVDNDGSETLVLTLTGMPDGFTLTDGIHSFAPSAAQRVVNLAGWQLDALVLTPPRDFNGSVALQLQATAIEGATGEYATTSQLLTAQFVAVADAPTLSLAQRDVAISRELVATSWETAANPSTVATVLAGPVLEGWTIQTPTTGKSAAFEIWAAGDRMANYTGSNVIVQPMMGNGNQWLALRNGRGNAAYQTIGVERSIDTIDGAIYTLNLDYAGGLGFPAAGTQIGIYVDGVKVGSYAGTSPSTALNWETLSFKFDGNGASRKIAIVLEGGDTIASGTTVTQRSAMIDDIHVIETLPVGAAVVYGLVGTGIALPKVSAALTDSFGSERLSLAVLGLPADATLDDGVHSAAGGAPVDLAGWDLAHLSVKASAGFVGEFSLTVQATSAETSNGASASVSQVVKVRVLAGTAVATPAGVNPFIVTTTAVQTRQQQAGSQAVAAAPSVAQGVLAGDRGQLGSAGDPAPLPKTAAEVAQAESDRARAMSDAWLKELEERAKAQWQQLVGGR
ncbi:MAG TPA: Ig-like domain-containing protein [Roseateles sp.]|nr:Ig-like domain-containing protein [Roseateles sp.]